MKNKTTKQGGVRVGMYLVHRDFISKLMPTSLGRGKKSNYCDLGRSMDVGQILFIHVKHWRGELGYNTKSSPQTTLQGKNMKGAKWSRRMFSEGWTIERTK